MSQSRFKDILVLLTGPNEALEAILSEMEIDFAVDELAMDSPELVITDNVEYVRSDREEVLLLTTSHVEMPYSVINPELLSNEVFKVALKRFLGESSSINVEANLKATTVQSAKITSPLSCGHYMDFVTSHIYQEMSEYKRSRKVYLDIIDLLVEKLESYPIDVDMIISNEMSVLQFSCVVENKDSDVADVVYNNFANQANFLNVYTIAKTNTLVICAIFLSENATYSRLIHHLDSFKKPNPNVEVYNSLNHVLSGEPASVNVEKSSSSNDAVRLKGIGVANIKRIISFLRDRGTSVDDIESALGDYPNQEIVKALSEEDYDFIRKSMNDNNFFHELNRTIRGSGEDVLQSNDVVAKLCDAIENLDSKEVVSGFNDDELAKKIISGDEDSGDEAQVVSGDFDEDDNSAQVVSGDFEDGSDQSQTIKGEREDLTEERTVISGAPEALEDTWKVKKLEIAEKIKEELTLLTDSGDFTKSEVRQRVCTTLKDNFGLDEREANKFMGLIEEEAASKNIEKSVEEMESDADSVFLRLENDRLRGSVEKKNEQIQRMSKIIETMKTDFAARVEAQQSLSGDVENRTPEELLKVAEARITQLLREGKTKDLRIEKLQEANDHTIKNKDQKIFSLEEKVSDLVRRNNSSVESSSGKSIAEVEAENKNLLSQVEVQGKRIEELSSKIDMNNTPKEASAPSEDMVHKDNLVKAEKRIETLEKSLEEARKAQAAAPSKDSATEIRDLKVQLKTSTLEAKKLEQKNKFMASQLKETEKKLKKAAGGKGGISNNGLGDKRAKQLEKQMEKITALKDKAEADVAEKKKDLHKQKQEMVVMQNTISELEKKLAKYEKKAA